ncbi:hypothetical protein [Halalkalibacterium ligniniphilum]|uniref:hypothetical protein n=1 Tax=Halalkalibacterium ligniniphilum TaxID=1134413 RepID=UPI000349BAC4|nr:hypothetical protein [Halalkalibacterium ligniniphilum]
MVWLYGMMVTMFMLIAMTAGLWLACIVTGIPGAVHLFAFNHSKKAGTNDGYSSPKEQSI